MSTFNAESNKTFGSKGPNRTFTKSPNKTFNAGKANRTFNSSGRNKAMNSSNLNRTFNANSNQTYNVDNPNATFGVQAPMQQTFNVTNPRMRTFNVTDPGMQTNNVKNSAMQTFSKQKQSSNTHNLFNQTYDIEEPIIGPEAPLNQFTSYEKKLLNDIEKLCNEIRSFIMSIFKFFCNNRSCNWEAVFALIGQIDLATQSMINEIFLQQMRIEDEREATKYSSDQSSSNFLPSTFNTQPSVYDDSYELNFDNSQSQSDHSNASGGQIDSFIEGLLNIKRAERNLKDFKNDDNLTQ